MIVALFTLVDQFRSITTQVDEQIATHRVRCSSERVGKPAAAGVWSPLQQPIAFVRLDVRYGNGANAAVIEVAERLFNRVA